MASLQTIFASFDLDKSGYLQIKELKQVAKKLGDPLSDKEINDLMKAIDLNKDGKISFQEFKEWWIKGHKGRLNELILLKAKSLKMYDFIKSNFKDTNLTFQNYVASGQKSKNFIQIEYKNPKFQEKGHPSGIKLGYAYQGQEYNGLLSQITPSVKQHLDENTFNFVLVFPSQKPKQFQKQLKVLLQQAFDQISLTTQISLSIDQLENNDYLNIKFLASEKEKTLTIVMNPGQMVKGLLQQMTQQKEELFEKLGEGFNLWMDIEVSLKTSLKELITQNKSFLQALMEGFTIYIHTSVESNAFKLFRRMLTTDNPKENVLLAPFLLFNKSQVMIRLKSPEKVEQFFKKLGILDIIHEIPSLNDLLDAIAPEVHQMKNNYNSGKFEDAPPLFGIFDRFFGLIGKYVQSGVRVLFMRKKYCVYGFIQGQGLKDLHDKLFGK